MGKTIVTLVCLAALVGGAWGCGSNSREAAPAATGEPARPTRVGLIPQSRPPIADLPVPIGFKLVESMSRDFKSADTRFVDHTYEGRDDKYDVERFYLEQMPLRNWVFTSKQMIGGQITMLFEKSGETVKVRIDDARGLFSNRTAIRIKINDPAKADAAKTN